MGDHVGWNIFRYVADYTHLTGMCLGLGSVIATKSVEGFSRKTQILYLIVYLTRYMDILTKTQVRYLLIFKVTFILITISMLFAFNHFSATYSERLDSCNLLAVLMPTGGFAVITSVGATLTDELWTWSEYLEPFALVPQYIVCYRAANLRPVVVLYILLVGGYRFGYICNWIYKRYMLHGAYHDYTSWAGGVLECVLFVDFVLRLVRSKEGASLLGNIMLTIDGGAGKASENFEMAVLGRRLPYGLSGSPSVVEDDKKHTREWDASDRKGDEESSGLLTAKDDDEFASLELAF